MSFPRYESYKDSGVEWLGEVPGHWETKRLKFLGEAIIGLTYDPLEVVDEGQGTLVLRSSNVQEGKIVFFDNVFVKKVIPERLVTKTGDILICSRNGSRALIGKNAIIRGDSEGLTFGAFMTIYRSIYNQYLAYVFNSSIFEFQSGSFLTSTVNQLTIGNLYSFSVPLPAQVEQQTIAAFLDRETAKIDALIIEQQRLIEFLKEKRQAVISHAVTKGLNPNAPMKDSGIEWLGEVPAHWEIKRLGLLSVRIQTGPFGSQLHSGDYTEDGTPVINPSNIQADKIVPDWSNTVGHEIVERLRQHKLKAGDIIFGRRGEMGRCAKVSDTEIGWLCGTGCLNVRLNASVLSEFVSIYFGTAYVREFLKLESVGSTMENLNTEILSRIPIPVPLLEEQQTIADFLDQETAKLDTLTSEAKTAITLFQERRTALISAAVTGKIDVRGLVSAKPEVKTETVPC